MTLRNTYQRDTSPLKLPTTLATYKDIYDYVPIQVISLACKGHVAVRTVFKFISAIPVDFIKANNKTGRLQGADCTPSRLGYIDDTPITEGGDASAIVRCELQLPVGSGSEVDRALRSKEVNCRLCGKCPDGFGCPAKPGVWYSDSYMTKAAGCDFDPSKGYYAHRVGMIINPETKVLLAKFEVCGSPGCFNQAYEAAKLKSAKPCYQGRCT